MSKKQQQQEKLLKGVEIPVFTCAYCKHQYVPRKSTTRFCPKCNHCRICGKSIFGCKCRE